MKKLAAVALLVLLLAGCTISVYSEYRIIPRPVPVIYIDY